MDSPAKGDSRQGLKGTQKHLEFQLQREKAYTRELEEKVKSQQAQIATLEQEKAELRRERLMHNDDDRKRTKLEERCHSLQKDLSEKQSAFLAEQKRATKAECEKEQIRRDAHASIAKWCDAEKQWITENETLQKHIEELKASQSKLSEEYKELNGTLKEVQRQLQREKEHSTKLEDLSQEEERKITLLHSRIEALQNDVHARDETVFKLEEMRSKWQETCHAKDNEIKSMEVQLGVHKGTIDKLQGTISTLNQQIEAAKLLNIEEKGKVEKVSCDLRESEKGNKLLSMELATVRRDFEHASQNASKHQELIAELRARVSSLNDQVIEKCAEARKHELFASQLKADVSRLEQERTESGRAVASLQTDAGELRTMLERARMEVESANNARVLLEAEVQRMKNVQESKDESLVLMKAECEEKVDALLRDTKELTSEISARQRVIDELTSQLGEAKERNEDLYCKVMQGSQYSTQLRTVSEGIQMDNFTLQVKVFVLEEHVSRLILFEQFTNETLDARRDLAIIAKRAWMKSSGEVISLEGKLEELASEKEKEISRLLEALSLQEAEKAELARTKTGLFEELGLKKEEILTLQEQARQYEEKLSTLQKEVEAEKASGGEYVAEMKVLTDKLTKMEASLQEASVQCEHQTRLSECVTKCSERFTLFFDDVVDTYDALTTEKMGIMATECLTAYMKTSEELLHTLTNMEAAQRRSEESRTYLQKKLSEAESRAEERERLFGQQKEGLTRKINTIENEKEKAERCTETLMEKVNSLSKQHVIAIKKKEDEMRELSCLLDAEKRRVSECNERAEKLQTKLDYETSRKGEYRKALEAVKAKREETERFRAKEKDWAMQAINRANEEVSYWMKSFEQLKGMLEDISRKPGAKITDFDREKIQTMEDAMCKVSLREPNSTSSACDDGSCGVKRRRTDQ